MNVAKRSTVPPLTLTHFEWVPGMQTTASSAASTPKAPSNWVSSPRMTSGAFAVALRNSWQDPDVAILSRNRDGMLQDGCERRRRVDVSGFNPSLSGTGHAADDDGQLMRGADGLQMRLQHGREAKLACRHHALVAAPFPEDVAGPVDEPKPKTARAPIDRDVCSLFHFNPAQCYLRLCDIVSRRSGGRGVYLPRQAFALQLICRDAISMIRGHAGQAA